MTNDFLVMRSKVGDPKSNIGIFNKVVTSIYEILNEEKLNAKSADIDKALWILEFESKIVCSMQFIMTSLDLPKDITTQPKQEYAHVWKHIHLKKIASRDRIESGMNLLKKGIYATTSACINEHESDWLISKVVSFALSLPKYLIAEKEGKLRSMVFNRKPTLEMAKNIWNLPENGFFNKMTKLSLKNIKYNRKIYVPIDRRKEPEDIFIDEGNSIQVRLLYDQTLYYRKQKKSLDFMFCGEEIEE